MKLEMNALKQKNKQLTESLEGFDNTFHSIYETGIDINLPDEDKDYYFIAK
jgi:hypothetical protein